MTTNQAPTTPPLRDREIARQEGFTLAGVKRPNTDRNFSRTSRRTTRTRKTIR